MILREPLLSQLQKKGKIPWKKLDEILKESGEDCSRFCQIAIRLGYLGRDDAGMAVGDSIGHTYMNLANTLFQSSVVAKLLREVATKYLAIPIYQLGTAITVAMSEPHDYGKVSVLEKLLGCTVDATFSFTDEIQAAIEINYQTTEKVTSMASGVNLDALVRLSEDELAELRPIVGISESIILMALKERASDIHIEPKRTECIVRFRIDGLLAARVRLPAPLSRPLVARYKVMANLDIAESRKPQDGRISFPTPQKSIDIRVSTLPLVHGEKIVMRLLGSLSDEVQLNLDKLNISPSILEPLKKMLAEPSGIVFVTGPTGSGKSTTLYAALNFVNSPDTNITTIEDPVEYEVTTLNQSSVDMKAGRTFQTILRSILRQDPDVILIGEIRDAETARIAVQAALTGHLVLSSLHTNNALQAMTRLVDMGVEPYVVAPSVIGVLGQRLVRKLCPGCKKLHEADPELLEQFFYWKEGATLPRLYKAIGCEECGGSGYRGRIAIHEVFKVTQEVRDFIMKGRTYSELRALAYGSGFTDMRFDGFKKAFQGLTTLEEIVRVTSTEQ